MQFNLPAIYNLTESISFRIIRVKDNDSSLQSLNEIKDLYAHLKRWISYTTNKTENDYEEILEICKAIRPLVYIGESKSSSSQSQAEINEMSKLNDTFLGKHLIDMPESQSEIDSYEANSRSSDISVNSGNFDTPTNLTGSNTPANLTDSNNVADLRSSGIPANNFSQIAQQNQIQHKVSKFIFAKDILGLYKQYNATNYRLVKDWKYKVNGCI